MELRELKNVLSKEYKIDISKKTRKRDYVYARKVFFKIARGLNYTLENIGNELNTPHDLVIYHLNSMNVINEVDKIIHNKVIMDNNLDIKLFDVEEKNEQAKELNIKPSMQSIYKMLSNWSDEDLKVFKETRIMPYDKMLKSKKENKVKSNVSGAVIRRPVKNPFL